eukprot:scaffold185258_cov19-Tisochrysis_lutea.AAC.1
MHWKVDFSTQYGCRGGQAAAYTLHPTMRAAWVRATSASIREQRQPTFWAIFCRTALTSSSFRLGRKGRAASTKSWPSKWRCSTYAQGVE